MPALDISDIFGSDPTGLPSPTQSPTADSLSTLIRATEASTLSTQVLRATASSTSTPMPTATASPEDVAKLQDKLAWYKIYHRNSAVAFSVLAILIALFIGIKIWLCVRRRKKAVVQKAVGGRSWFGSKAAAKVVNHLI